MHSDPTAIDQPLSFNGSATAQCFNVGNGPEVDSPDLGRLDNKVVRVHLIGAGVHQGPSAQSPQVAPSVGIEISMFDGADPELGVYYGSQPEDPPIESHAAADGSRTVTFDRLEKLGDSTDPNFGPDTISGTISWTC